MESAEKNTTRIFFHEGTWRVSLDQSEGVPIPRQLAYWIRSALTANKWFDAKSSLYKNYSESDKQYREYYSYNCHRTALAVQGTLYDMLSGDLSHLAYHAAHDYKTGVRNDIEKYKIEPGHMERLPDALRTTKAPCVVHLEQSDSYGERFTHSFVFLGVDTRARLLCFDKSGVRNAPFRVTSYEQIERSYTPRFHAVYIMPTILESQIPQR